MNSNKRAVWLFLMLVVMAGCGGGSGGGAASPAPGVGGPSASGNNVVSVTVNGSLCSVSNSYPNKPCVSVTICTPGSATCQTINDILLDTGSYGLRIFSQALSVPLPQVSGGSGAVAECVQFGDGSSLWGPVQTADIILGNEPAVRVPIQVADATFGSRPTACQNAEATPTTAGFSGILGVGLFSHDCGTACVNSSSVGIYYACSGTACGGTTVPLASQVMNPVAALPADNNGVIVQLPAVPAGAAGSASGSVILGIGTQANNVPSGVTRYGADQFAEFTTIFNGTTYAGFLDTGSNGLFFPSPSASQLPACASPYTAWFCPAATADFSATTRGAGGSPSGAVSFRIGNAAGLFGTSNRVFAELGGGAANSFDWGLPFFLGRSVYVGIDGAGSSLGTGPYWAY
ncbi:DUF3443 domain-containing protein [Geobacter sp. FeAm09]|uniref:DUF3443 domain-containing protein n=1 Tax=Geobacter sp. FeAm09 TaxID=2597769 RepID=UPI0011EECD90|nr:DUF3443 domain-containing protein [Geobacter sp. FeAm09]QEM67087.1 DUF3443 domain-containing protein [Geobacter sp. FeAm09]